jgi:hypothetical protein
MTFPGDTVVVTLVDRTIVRGRTRWSWSALRLRDAQAFSADGTEQGHAANVVVPSTAIVSIQVL